MVQPFRLHLGTYPANAKLIAHPIRKKLPVIFTDLSVRGNSFGIREYAESVYKPLTSIRLIGFGTGKNRLKIVQFAIYVR